ncbi:MAG: NAD(+) synthase [Sphaerochaetaceae bacterium]
MRDGFLKCATYSPVVHVADCSFNEERLKEGIEKADKEGVRLIVFPELCITGYTCADLFLQQVLLNGALSALSDLILFSRGFDMVMVFGLPLSFGGYLYNCAVVVYNGKILGVVPKSNIPNYQEFYERRWFSPAPEGVSIVTLCRQLCPFGASLLFACTTMRDFVLGVEVCEDLWVPLSPSVNLALAGATVIVNPSASDELVGKAQYRVSLVSSQSGKLVCGYIYCDAGFGESSTDLVFASHNLICENGTVLGEQFARSAQLLVTELDVNKLALERKRMTTFNQRHTACTTVEFALTAKDVHLTRFVDRSPFVPSDEATRFTRCETILTLQSLGLQKRLSHVKVKDVVVGLSGGLDSTLALLVCVRSFDALNLDRKGILAVTMPGFGTTKRTRGNATVLANALGVSLYEVDISKAVLQHFADIGQDVNTTDITYENSQARERTQILMDLANKRNALVIGTGDLSELALGWATYNGDHMSMYAVNCSVPKTLVRHLVRHVAMKENEEIKKVLLDVIDTPVSPELLPASSNGTISQITEDIVGPYELHDFFLYYMVRWGFEPKKIFRLALIAFEDVYQPDFILKWLKNYYRRFFSQQFKRSCLPDGPKVGSVTLSPRGDWRMPSDACATLWIDQVEKISL